jgi:hypothetical protein
MKRVFHHPPTWPRSLRATPGGRRVTLRALDIGTFLCGCQPLRRKSCMRAGGPRAICILVSLVPPGALSISKAGSGVRVVLWLREQGKGSLLPYASRPCLAVIDTTSTADLYLLSHADFRFCLRASIRASCSS